MSCQLFSRTQLIPVPLAKNVILAGPRAVSLWDPAPAQLEDLSANFFLSESLLGVPRCEAVASQLAELNSYVQVQTLLGELTESALSAFKVSSSSVVSTDSFHWSLGGSAV